MEGIFDTDFAVRMMKEMLPPNQFPCLYLMRQVSNIARIAISKTVLEDDIFLSDGMSVFMGRCLTLLA